MESIAARTCAGSALSRAQGRGDDARTQRLGEVEMTARSGAPLVREVIAADQPVHRQLAAALERRWCPSASGMPALQQIARRRRGWWRLPMQESLSTDRESPGP